MHRFLPHPLRCVSAAFLSICCVSAAAAVTGPTEVPVGTLATFESDIEGDAIVYPIDKGTLAKDSNGKRVYFATPEEGSYTLLFFGVRDGKAEISPRQFSVVTSPTPVPAPGPSPEPAPEPTPEPKPEPSPVQSLTVAERQALGEAAAATLQAIDEGAVRTPQGARSAFKNALWSRAKVCSAAGCSLPQALSKAVSEYEKRMNLTTLEGLRAGMELIKEETKEAPQ